MNSVLCRSSAAVHCFDVDVQHTLAPPDIESKSKLNRLESKSSLEVSLLVLSVVLIHIHQCSSSRMAGEGSLRLSADLV
jgi:hypothetical protein